MYKCTECGCEYEEKPDFCDCGNDEFVAVAEGGANNENVENLIAKPKKPIETDAPKVQSAKPQSAQPAGAHYAKSVYTKPVISQKTFAERYPMLSEFFKSLDPISTGIFFICLILTVIVILYKPEIAEKPVTQKEIAKTVKDIPHIDKFWNNTLPQVEKKVEEKEMQKTVIPEVQKIVQNITQPIVQPKTMPKTTTQKTTAQKTKQTTQTAKKTTQSKTTSMTQQKPQTTQTTKTTAQTAKPASTAIPAQTVKTSQQQPTAQVQQAQPAPQPQAAQTAKTAQNVSVENVAKNNAQAKQELANYKAGIRNTIGRKIDFTKVVGDGNCVVSFKVNSSGKLTNRAFAQQSSNMTLNDAVYAAVMATPVYNPPPSTYNNETMNLIIKFYNGNFEISIK